MKVLKKRFENLTEKEKTEFIKKIMPDIQQILGENPVLRKEMMEKLIEKVDAFQIINMMEKFM